MLFLKFMCVMAAICLFLAMCFVIVDFFEDQLDKRFPVLRKGLIFGVFGSAITIFLGMVVGLLYVAVKM